MGADPPQAEESLKDRFRILEIKVGSEFHKWIKKDKKTMKLP